MKIILKGCIGRENEKRQMICRSRPRPLLEFLVFDFVVALLQCCLLYNNIYLHAECEHSDCHLLCMYAIVAIYI